MGLFNKKPQEDEWELLPDDYEYDNDSFDDYISAPIDKPSKQKNQKKIKKEKIHKEPKKKQKNKKEKTALNQRPEIYEDDNVNNYNYDDIDYLDKDSGYIYVNKKRPKSNIPKIWIIIFTVILSISSLGVIGYINTDFDDNGNAYVIPLNIHYKRKYAQTSDDVLDYINEINDELKSNIDSLPNNYLLNFSLLTQEYLTNLIENYSNSNYEEFAYNGMNDFRDYLSEINSLRVQMDSVLFSNQKNYSSEYKSKSKTNKTEKSKNTNSNNSYFNTSKNKKSDDK